MAGAEPTSDPILAGQDELEVDESAATDSAYGDDQSSLSTSVSSSVRAYRWEYGRRYHAFKEGAYVYPNDDKENDRLDLQHAQFLKSCDDKLYLAPIPDNVQNVLDLGTGTGIWAIDFADIHPQANVVGVDLSPIQPTWVPANVSFLVDDLQDEWIYNQQFDFMHARMMAGALQNWEHIFEQAFKNLRPGGWFELQDINLPFRSDDGTLSPDTALYKWSQLSLTAGAKLGRPVNAAENYKRWMEEAGFVDVHEVVHKWPQNPWPKQKKHKELGLWTMTNMLEGMHGLSVIPFTLAHGMTEEEIELFLMDVRKDIKNPKIRCYWTIYFVYGRKPE